MKEIIRSTFESILKNALENEAMVEVNDDSRFRFDEPEDLDYEKQVAAEQIGEILKSFLDNE